MNNNLNKYISHFNDYWFEFSKKINLSSEKSQYLHQLLLSAYTEAQRYYHTVQHIVECLDLFKKVQGDIQNPILVELAIWFHDVIYDPQSKENEIHSGLLVQDECVDFLNEEQIADIFMMILATMHHDISDNNDINYLLDIDLAILGSNPKRFQEYELQIQQEYSWVDREIFKQKRSEVLAKFYAMQSIYKTEYFQNSFEQQARLNLENTLAKN